MFDRFRRAILRHVFATEAGMQRVRVGAGRQVSLRVPAKVARRFKLRKGTSLEVHVARDGLLLVPPGRIPKDQRYFWTPEWQAMEAEADADLAAGRVHGPYATAEEAIAKLRGKAG
jgi:antitoxin component of MazEF toxin-antitoxin module